MVGGTARVGFGSNSAIARHQHGLAGLSVNPAPVLWRDPFSSFVLLTMDALKSHLGPDHASVRLVVYIVDSEIIPPRNSIR